MRIVFMGSPAFSVPVLQALVVAGHELACVYAQPARPSGRGQKVLPTPVEAAARDLGLPVCTPATLKDPAAQEAFAALQVDAAVVVAYGLILPRAVLAAPRLGCFNLHASLLPRWRGAAPIQRAILAGDPETGVQVMGMEAGLDTGPVYATARTPIGPQDTGTTVHDRLSALGAALMVEALPAIAAGSLHPVPQAQEGVTYAAKIDRAETRIDWSAPAVRVDRQIRAFAASPGAWCLYPDGSRLRVLMSAVAPGGGPAAPGTVLDRDLTVACGAGTAVRLLSVQREGRPVVDAGTFQRGTPLAPGFELR